MACTIVECGRCGTPLPQNDKNFRYDKRDAVYRRMCRTCESVLQSVHRGGQKNYHGVQQDFAALYVYQLRTQLHSTGLSVACLPVEDLRAIMLAQAYTDYLTREKFILPTNEEVKQYRSWQRWLDTLSPKQQARTPVLVCVKPGAWVVGNVLYVARLWAVPIDAAGGWLNFKTQCELVLTAELVVPQPNAVTAIQATWSVNTAAEVKKAATDALDTTT